MGITTRLPAPLGAGAHPAREWPGEQPPDEISRGLFGQSRRLMRTHPLAADTLRQMGYEKVSSLAGGFRGWAENGGDIDG